MNNTKLWGCAMLSIVIVAPPVKSAEAIFGFESEAVSNTIQAFSMTADGITASFLDPDAYSWIQDQNPTPGVPPHWGHRQFLPAVFTTRHQIIDFNVKLTSFSVEFGDYSPPSNNESDNVHLRAWSGLGGTGTVVDVDNVFYPGAFHLPGNVGTAGVSSDVGFLSVELWEDGSTGENDIYVDNIHVIAVPEPVSGLALISLAAVAFVNSARPLRLRRRCGQPL